MSIFTEDRLPRDVTTKSPNDYAPPTERSRLASLEAELKHGPLDEISNRLSRLTYGEMKEFAAGIGGDPDKVWEWAFAKAEKRK